jgi:hypothetical protein
VSEDLIHDPLLGTLSRFRPTSVGIDRDAMLVAIGRASAPNGRGWKVAVAILALSNVVMVGLWLGGSRLEPRRDSLSRPVDLPPAVSPLPASESEPVYGDLVRWRTSGELPPPLPPFADPVPSSPILSIAASQSALIVD